MGVSPGDLMRLRPLLEAWLWGPSLGVKPDKALFCSGPQALLACYLHDVGGGGERQWA